MLVNKLVTRRGVCHAPRRSASVAARAVTVQDRAVLKTGSSELTFCPIINGCWQLAGGHGREVFDNLEEKLEAHANAGFTTFDTADIYGPSESILGAFAAARREAGKPPVQIFTKLCPRPVPQPTPASVEAAIRKSMKALQTDSLDCVQMHWWDYSLPGMVDTGKALADLQAKGLIKHVATTNMDVQALQKLVDAGVHVAANQVQFSLLDRRPLNGMLQFAQQHGVKLFTYGSVGGGLLSDRHVEEPKAGLFGKVRYTTVDLNTSSLKMYWNIVKAFGGQELWRELLVVMKKVADKHQVSVANVALRWVMQQGDGNTVFPLVGMRTAAHIEDNARVLTFRLDDQDMRDLDGVLSRSSGPQGDIYSFERGW